MILKHSFRTCYSNPCQTVRKPGSLSYRLHSTRVTRFRGRLAGRLVRRAQAPQRLHLPELPAGSVRRGIAAGCSTGTGTGASELSG